MTLYVQVRMASQGDSVCVIVQPVVLQCRSSPQARVVCYAN